MSSHLARRGALALALLALVACRASKPSAGPSNVTPTTRAVTSASTTSSTTTATTTTVAATTTSSPTVPPTTAARAFSGSAVAVTAAELGATYHAGCPVGPAALRRLRLAYWGFDGRAHTGAIVVNAAVVQPVLTVFSALYRARFPIREMVPVDAFGGSDPASMAADNTSGFNCRPVQGTNPPRWSVHAYGEAIDVDPVENPYILNGGVQPAAARAYVDRSRLRPGTAAPGTALNDAFASIGWGWGGRFNSPDYQHFSQNGR